MKGNRSGKGYIQPEGKESLSRKVVGAKLPASMEAEIRKVAGEDLAGWIRKAFAAQLEKDKDGTKAAI